jgi:hypothetical protein
LLLPLRASAGLVPVARRPTGYFGTAPEDLLYGLLPSAADAFGVDGSGVR